MRILLVSATSAEIAPLINQFRSGGPPSGHLSSYEHAGKTIDVLTCGVGMMTTAARCARELTLRPYDFALNVGVCGTFDGTLALGTVVHVVRDRIADLGAEDGDAFLPIEQLGLDAEIECVNAHAPNNAVLASLPAVCGITVNTVHGNEGSIAAIVQRLHPQVESMEGAGFMYASALSGVTYAQVRAVSNRVERRNRDAWKLADAIRNLAHTATRIIEAA